MKVSICTTSLRPKPTTFPPLGSWDNNYYTSHNIFNFSYSWLFTMIEALIIIELTFLTYKLLTD